MMSYLLPKLLRPASERRSQSGARATPAWLREPLLHFVLLGVLLFALDRWIDAGREDPHAIVVGAAVDREAREIFKASRGRDPDPKELAALRRAWLDNEVLYREGLAMQVDRGDPAIRERVIFKALSVVDANLKAPPLDEQRLREWFESHRGQYDEPARYDFQEAVLSGETGESAVRAFADALNRGAPPADVEAGLRVFKGRPHENLVQSYGADFARALEASPPGQWRAFATRDGWRAMRLDTLQAAKPAAFEALHGVVLQDWTDATMSEQRTAAVRELARKYRVTYEVAP
jgi:hypothetical protein